MRRPRDSSFRIRHSRESGNPLADFQAMAAFRERLDERDS